METWPAFCFLTVGESALALFYRREQSHHPYWEFSVYGYGGESGIGSGTAALFAADGACSGVREF
jgi:hypothetical protein